MAPPFRIGLMQLTMEPLGEMLETARTLDEAGLDTIWLAEAYPWWRKHGMEAKSSTVLSALMARDTERLTIGWGIISPYTRHPVQVAMDARIVQEAAGPGRFIVGFGTSKIFLNNTKQGGPPKETKPLGHMRDSVAIVRGALGGERFEYDGKVFSADLPAVQSEAHAPRLERAGVRRRDRAADAAARRRDRRRAAHPVDHHARPSSATRARTSPPAPPRRAATATDLDVGCTIVASIHATDRDAGRDGAREIAGMYLANKFQNIKGSADTLLDLAEIRMEELQPVAEAMESGGRLAAKAQVTDSLLDRCKPIAGTPADCIARDRGVPRRRLLAHHARALGGEQARSDPSLRRAGRYRTSENRHTAAHFDSVRKETNGFRQALDVRTASCSSPQSRPRQRWPVIASPRR